MGSHMYSALVTCLAITIFFINLTSVFYTMVIPDEVSINQSLYQSATPT